MQQLHMNSFLKLLLLYQTTTFIVGPKYKKTRKWLTVTPNWT